MLSMFRSCEYRCVWPPSRALPDLGRSTRRRVEIAPAPADFINDLTNRISNLKLVMHTSTGASRSRHSRVGPPLVQQASLPTRSC